MSTADYLAGVLALLLAGASVVVAAVALRAVLAPGLRGTTARLAEAVLGAGVLTLVAQALGTFGLLRRGPLLALLAAVAVASVGVWRRRRPVPADPMPESAAHPRWAPPAALLIAAAVATQWIGQARDATRAGVSNVDSLQYHLPFAAHFAEGGSTTQLHHTWFDPVHSFYPHTAELFHGIGMVLLGRDLASIPLNVIWLGVALLAAWCLGSRWGVGHLTLAGTAALLTTPVMASSQPGAGTNDAFALAMLLAALALLAHADDVRALVALAGLAGGLAVGVKVTVIAAVAGATVVLVVTARRPLRLAVARAWLLALALGGAYWYLRNLFRTGSPVPMIAVPGLASPELPVVDANGRSIAHYLDDSTFWQDYVRQGFRLAFSRAYPLVLLAALGGLIATAVTLRRSPPGESNASVAALRRIRLILLVAAVGGLTLHVFTPTSAYGPEGNPILFWANLRYACPALACALALVGLATVGRAQLQPALMAGFAVVVVVGIATGTRRIDAQLERHPALFVVALLAVAVGWWGRDLARRRVLESRRGRALAAAAAVAALGLAVVLADTPADRYLARRYVDGGLGQWARSVHDSRIAVVGWASQYPLVGLDLSNEVEYLGRTRADGGLATARECDDLWAMVVEGEYDFVVAGDEKWGVEAAPENGWLRSGRAAQPVAGSRGASTTFSRQGRVSATAFRISDEAATAPRC